MKIIEDPIAPTYSPLFVLIAVTAVTFPAVLLTVVAVWVAKEPSGFWLQLVVVVPSLLGFGTFFLVQLIPPHSAKHALRRAMVVSSVASILAFLAALVLLIA